MRALTSGRPIIFDSSDEENNGHGPEDVQSKPPNQSIRRRRLGANTHNSLLLPLNERKIRDLNNRSSQGQHPKSTQLVSGESALRFRTAVQQPIEEPKRRPRSCKTTRNVAQKEVSECERSDDETPPAGDVSDFAIDESDEEQDDSMADFIDDTSPEVSLTRRRIVKERSLMSQDSARDTAGKSQRDGHQKGSDEETCPSPTTQNKPRDECKDKEDSFLSRRFLKMRFNESTTFAARDDQQGRLIIITPPGTPTKSRPAGLVSPKKLPRIPATPHHAGSDAFWSQDFVDDWNDEHSPKKQLFLSEIPKSPTKKSPSKKAVSTTAAEKAARKAFEESKHEMADAFLKELDEKITNSQIQELAKDTGGVQIKWSNTLNTTAGRANWKRETRRVTIGTSQTITHRHHASIELAEKVIDSQDRLFNVIAHEFCHLANFMVTGVKNNPHGKEFKAWASRCSAAFGQSHGIEVTTKHSYEINFRYIWECIACGLEYQRHSKSIDPIKHRCGSCKGQLAQTKPVPRMGSTTLAKGEGGVKAEKRGPTEYQRFMSEQMKVVKGDNPKSPQKDIMKLVAAKWAARNRGAGQAVCQSPEKLITRVDEVADALNSLIV